MVLFMLIEVLAELIDPRGEDGNLHFITTKNERKQIPFSQLDRSLTEQLNRERHVTFHLP